MEVGNNFDVKEEPFNPDEDEPDDLPLNEDENYENFVENEEHKSQSKGGNNVMSLVQLTTPPSCKQNRIVGAQGKWKIAKEKKQYNCKTCKYKFTSKTWLIKHERMHENMDNKAKLYKCEICRKEFAQKIIYHDHMAAHAGKRPYVCDRCGMDFTWYRAFYRHQQHHKTGGKDFSCHLCQRRFNNNWNLSRHLKDIHQSKQTFKCGLCEELFEKKNLYQMHMKAHDRAERDRRKKIGIVSERVKQKHLKLSKVVRTMMQSQLENKNKVIDNGDIMSNNDNILASELIEKISENIGEEDTNVPCDVDNNIEISQKISEPESAADDCFVDAAATNGSRHTDIVIKPSIVRNQKLSRQLFPCDICGKHVYHLNVHLRIHSGEKPFTCCLCDKDFAQREALKIHYRSHTGEKPFACNTCGKRFATRGLQKDHALAHKGDKPYQCNVCDARFSWRGALSRHKQLHSTGPKPHACSVCTFECRRKHDLLKHEKTHLYDNNRYKCDFENCTAVFSNKKHFIKHKKIHKGSRLYESRPDVQIIKMQTAKYADNTEQIESSINDMADTVEIKEEPFEDCVDDNNAALDRNKSGTASIYIRRKEGQVETLVTNAIETHPDSGKLRYTRGEKLHLNPDLQLLLSKKINEKKHIQTRITDTRSSCESLKSNFESHIPLKQTPSAHVVDHFNYRKNQVTVSMDAVIENDCEDTKIFDDPISSNNIVGCEVCGKSLNISYYHIHVRKHVEEMAHKCDICKKSFSRKTDLIVHSRVHTNIRPFKCTICPKAFKVKSLLEDHVRSHDGIKPYVCSLCDASFAWRCALHRHVKTHSINKPFQCEVCGKDFRRRGDWAAHIQKKTCKYVKSIIYKCNDCQAVFANLETLVYHNDKHHKQISDSHSESPTVLNTSSEITKELKSEYLSPAPSEDSSTMFDNTTVPEESESVDEQTCKDDVLASKTTAKNVINPHNQFSLLSDTENKDDPCTLAKEAEDRIKKDIPSSEKSVIPIKKECEDNDSVVISGDMNSVDLTYENFPAQQIGKQNQDHDDDVALRSNKNACINWSGSNLQIEPSCLNQSSPITDVNEEKLKCKICGRSFVSSIGLKVHFRIHSKDAMDIYALHFRPDEMMTKSQREKEARNLKYKCKLCEKTFPFASGLRIHMMAHSGKLPYTCKICGKRFPYLESVKSHMRLHTGERPFTCDICGKSFAYRHNHDDHYRTHTGDKPYKCDRCDSAFTWKSALHRHHKTHSLETLEVCTICKAKFKNGGQLVRHMNRFHSSLV
ncbi:zinc finger protein 658B-like [Ylistrum balloti]|uniref:zinc finger protein 658B-like n=1 Tax=Ylistrum balloti TaxID=509963 RepID=UPI002905C120|nr:zinc finger protein 658B-like [Ylistrum balloti]